MSNPRLSDRIDRVRFNLEEMLAIKYLLEYECDETGSFPGIQLNHYREKGIYKKILEKLS